jgi:hypothetical protein
MLYHNHNRTKLLIQQSAYYLELKKKKDEAVKGFESLTVYSEEYLAVLTEEEKEQMEKKRYLTKLSRAVDKTIM